MPRVTEIRGWQLVKLLRALNEREGYARGQQRGLGRAALRDFEKPQPTAEHADELDKIEGCTVGLKQR